MEVVQATPAWVYYVVGAFLVALIGRVVYVRRNRKTGGSGGGGGRGDKPPKHQS